jgi:hypothetical protein
VKCRGFRVGGHGRWFPGARATASSSGRRLGPRRPTGADAMGRLPLPPAASAVHSPRGRRLSGPATGNLNPPSSFGHFAQDVTGPLLSSSVRLPRGRPKRCVRSGAAASAHRMQLLCRSAVSRTACGRSGSGTRRRITTAFPCRSLAKSTSSITAQPLKARTAGSRSKSPATRSTGWGFRNDAAREPRLPRHAPNRSAKGAHSGEARNGRRRRR